MVENLPAGVGDIRDVGLILGLGRSHGGGHATHCSILAWRIPWTEEPGGLQSMGVTRVRQDCACMHTYVTYSVINSPTFSSLEARIGKSEKTL